MHSKIMNLNLILCSMILWLSFAKRMVQLQWHTIRVLEVDGTEFSREERFIFHIETSHHNISKCFASPSQSIQKLKRLTEVRFCC
mmetsp:Transcript_12945/g.31721  ORF Transcript_12945/g.31721 Transcript_12945/m.31721 type:complete len:85 (-) Transcript_12945:264-518(-)